MRMDQCGPFDEIFTHIDEETALSLHINASAMLRAAELHLITGEAQVITTYIDPEFIKFIRERRGVEQWKVDRLEEPYLSLPAIGVWMPDGSCLTVDGHHRLVRWAERGDETYRIVVFDWDALGQYLVEDFPEDFAEFIVEETKAQTPNDVVIAKIMSGK